MRKRLRHQRCRLHPNAPQCRRRLGILQNRKRAADRFELITKLFGIGRFVEDTSSRNRGGHRAISLRCSASCRRGSPSRLKSRRFAALALSSATGSRIRYRVPVYSTSASTRSCGSSPWTRCSTSTSSFRPSDAKPRAAPIRMSPKFRRDAGSQRQPGSFLRNSMTGIVPHDVHVSAAILGRQLLRRFAFEIGDRPEVDCLTTSDDRKLRSREQDPVIVRERGVIA